MDTKRTGELIAALRREKGLTQEQLAKSLYLSHTTVSKWERGLGFPDVSVIEPLADTLGITVTELFRGRRAGAVEPLGEEAARNALRLTKMTRRRERLLRLLAVGSVLLLAAALLGWSLWVNARGPYRRELKGAYQTEQIDQGNGMFVWSGGIPFTLSAQDGRDEQSFVLYAGSVLLDQGGWEQAAPNYYLLHGEKSRYAVELLRDGSFWLLLPGMDEPSHLTKRGNVPIYFGHYAPGDAYDHLLTP